MWTQYKSDVCVWLNPSIFSTVRTEDVPIDIISNILYLKVKITKQP